MNLESPSAHFVLQLTQPDGFPAEEIRGDSIESITHVDGGILLVLKSSPRTEMYFPYHRVWTMSEYGQNKNEDKSPGPRSEVTAIWMQPDEIYNDGSVETPATRPFDFPTH